MKAIDECELEVDFANTHLQQELVDKPVFVRRRRRDFSYKHGDVVRRDAHSRNDRRRNCDRRDDSLEFAPRPRTDNTGFRRLKGAQLLAAAVEELDEDLHVRDELDEIEANEHSLFDDSLFDCEEWDDPFAYDALGDDDRDYCGPATTFN